MPKSASWVNVKWRPSLLNDDGSVVIVPALLAPVGTVSPAFRTKFRTPTALATTTPFGSAGLSRAAVTACGEPPTSKLFPIGPKDEPTAPQ